MTRLIVGGLAVAALCYVAVKLSFAFWLGLLAGVALLAFSGIGALAISKELEERDGKE